MIRLRVQPFENILGIREVECKSASVATLIIPVRNYFFMRDYFHAVGDIARGVNWKLINTSCRALHLT